MTYDEMLEIGEAVFDEYLPKTSARLRRSVLDTLFSELEDRGALEIEDTLVISDTEDSFTDEDEA